MLPLGIKNFNNCQTYFAVGCDISVLIRFLCYFFPAIVATRQCEYYCFNNRLKQDRPMHQKQAKQHINIIQHIKILFVIINIFISNCNFITNLFLSNCNE